MVQAERSSGFNQVADLGTPYGLRSRDMRRRALEWAAGAVLFALAAMATFNYSTRPVILVDRYANEIKSLEVQRQKLESALAAKRIVRLQSQLRNSPAGNAADTDKAQSFAASIGAYVKQLKNQLEPSKSGTTVSVKAPRHSHLDEQILTLRQEKQQLEKELSSIVVHTGEHLQSRSTVAHKHLVSKKELLKEKAALESKLDSYAKEKDPVVRGVLAKFQTAQGGVLANVKESMENVMGSLGATMSPAQKERQLLLEAEAMGDVTPKEAFSQRIIALGNSYLSSQPTPHDAPTVLAVSPRPEAHRRTLERGRVDRVVPTTGAQGARPMNMVEKLQLELKQAERVANLQHNLEAARHELALLEH